MDARAGARLYPTEGPHKVRTLRHYAWTGSPIMIRTRLTTFALVAMASAFAQSAFAEAPEALGKVHFQTSCKPDAQQLFDQGMLYQHSFWYRASQKSFEDALKADPECAIAYWGIALSLLYNPHVAPPVKNLAEGAAALEKGRALGAKTPRERDYIEALGAMYTDYDKVDHRTRVLAYLKAMEQLAQRYPDDDEAQIHYALALNVAASPADKTYANQLKGAAILEKIWTRQPEHPGIAHYLIHLYDTPALAEKGTRGGAPLRQGGAGRGARAAHAVAHFHPPRLLAGVDCFQHRIGARCEASWGSPRPAALDGLSGLCLSAARTGRQGQDRHRRHDEGHRPHGDFPSRAVRAGCFAGALRDRARRLEGRSRAASPPSPLANVQAITYFARALGAARSGNPDAAKIDIAKLVELRDKLRDAKDGYWSEQVDIQRQVATAWVLYAEGKRADALNAMSAAADAEDKTEKHPVTPGVPRPARELYGVMLLDSGNAKEALIAFEATLKKEPNRLGAYAGAATSAEKAGDKAKAREYYEKILAIADGADDSRTEIADARAYLKKL